jgi:hypothetical protein
MSCLRLPSQIHGSIRSHKSQRGRTAGRNPDTDPVEGRAPERDSGRACRSIDARRCQRTGLLQLLDTEQGSSTSQHESQANVHVAVWQRRRSARQL